MGSKNARNLTSSWNITSSIFQLNAQYIKYTYLPNTLQVFQCVFYHTGWEHRVTWSQTVRLYKAITRVVLQNVKCTFFYKIYSFFLQCLQQYVLHVLVCWVMVQSHTQHTKTQEQHNNRTQGLSRSPHHYRPKHSWVQWRYSVPKHNKQQELFIAKSTLLCCKLGF